MTFKQDYMRGLDALHDYAPFFYRIMRFLGVPAENYGIPTAQVSFNPADKTVLFEINPDLIKDMSDEEVGFVIAHEAYHVLLRHLSELQMVDDFPDNMSLVYAHEAIVNDTVKSILGLDHPDMDLVFGERFGADFSGFSTRQGYDWITQNQEQDEDSNSGSDGEQSENNENSEDSSDSTSGNGSGDSAEGSSDTNSDNGSDSDSANSDENDDQGKDNTDETEGTDQDGSGADNADSSEQDGNGKPQYGVCGGVQVPEGSMQDFMNAVADTLRDAVSDAKNANESIDGDLLTVLDDFGADTGVDITGGYGIGSNTGSMFVGQMDDMNLDWKTLVAEINPDIMSAGGGPKYKDSWRAPRRTMMSVYPKVILPKSVRETGSDENGSDVPTFILALDMSYSIPTRLIAGLANLADTVPEKFVKVMPVTWADYVKDFDTNKKDIVPRGGTNIDAVWEYSQKVKKKIGKEPYVFVITDGGCSFGDYSYSRSGRSQANANVVQKYWYWGAIDAQSVNSIKHNMNREVDKRKVYKVEDFLV